MANLLPREAYIEFQKLYQTFYGIELTYEEAVQKGNKFFEMFRSIYKPISKKMRDKHTHLTYETEDRNQRR